MKQKSISINKLLLVNEIINLTHIARAIGVLSFKPEPALPLDGHIMSMTWVELRRNRTTLNFLIRDWTKKANPLLMDWALVPFHYGIDFEKAIDLVCRENHLVTDATKGSL